MRRDRSDEEVLALLEIIDYPPLSGGAGIFNFPFALSAPVSASVSVSFAVQRRYGGTRASTVLVHIQIAPYEVCLGYTIIKVLISVLCDSNIAVSGWSIMAPCSQRSSSAMVPRPIC